MQVMQYNAPEIIYVFNGPIFSLNKIININALSIKVSILLGGRLGELSIFFIGLRMVKNSVSRLMRCIMVF